MRTCTIPLRLQMRLTLSLRRQRRSEASAPSPRRRRRSLLQRFVRNSRSSQVQSVNKQPKKKSARASILAQSRKIWISSSPHLFYLCALHTGHGRILLISADPRDRSCTPYLICPPHGKLRPWTGTGVLPDRRTAILPRSDAMATQVQSRPTLCSKAAHAV
ncbi:hypothetical protein GGR56DRAFT_578652 [Xylariaceae sp. FL0804]|nr:hypothetical protein GGR56DRAFT_578652 [Xylariaceae sp. FL0804]